MDYLRVYAEFIADRRAREPGLTGYVERHHIVPRSLGGGDEAENLIRLTAEDHYFAHLLLAKSHGGKMISALWRMLQSAPTHLGRKHDARASYGLARRLVAVELKRRWMASGNPLHNDTLHEWTNYRTGETTAATLYEMHAAHGGSRGIWTQVAQGDRPSIFGWLISARLGSHKRSEKGKGFLFVNRDGRTFSGTQAAFSIAFGVNAASCSRIVRGGSVTECGWRLDGTQDRRANAPKDGRRGTSTGTGKVYSLKHKDGRTFEGTAEDFRILVGKPLGFPASVYLSTLTRGAAPTVYGWSIINAPKRTKHSVGGTLLPCA